jgi:hypothetical protein
MIAVNELVLHDPDRFPSLADVLYLAGCPLIAACFLGLVHARTAGRDRANWIDATIVASGFALLSWVFVMRPPPPAAASSPGPAGSSRWPIPSGTCCSSCC